MHPSLGGTGWQDRGSPGGLHGAPRLPGWGFHCERRGGEGKTPWRVLEGQRVSLLPRHHLCLTLRLHAPQHTQPLWGGEQHQVEVPRSEGCAPEPRAYLCLRVVPASPPQPYRCWGRLAPVQKQPGWQGHMESSWPHRAPERRDHLIDPRDPPPSLCQRQDSGVTEPPTDPGSSSPTGGPVVNGDAEWICCGCGLLLASCCDRGLLLVHASFPAFYFLSRIREGSLG